MIGMKHVTSILLFLCNYFFIFMRILICTPHRRIFGTKDDVISVQASSSAISNHMMNKIAEKL